MDASEKEPRILTFRAARRGTLYPPDRRKKKKRPRDEARRLMRVDRPGVQVLTERLLHVARLLRVGVLKGDVSEREG